MASATGLPSVACRHMPPGWRCPTSAIAAFGGRIGWRVAASPSRPGSASRFECGAGNARRRSARQPPRPAPPCRHSAARVRVHIAGPVPTRLTFLPGFSRDPAPPATRPSPPGAPPDRRLVRTAELGASAARRNPMAIRRKVSNRSVDLLSSSRNVQQRLASYFYVHSNA